MNIPTVSANLLDQFARTLMTSLDGSRDRQLFSTTEFTSFLTTHADTGLGTPNRAHPTGHQGPAPLMAGFNDAKLGNPSHTTVKYLFGRVAQRYSLASVHDKASAESLLQQMRPELEAAGITVLDVRGDKIQVLDGQGSTTWVDVIHGASAGDPAFQWHDLRFEELRSTLAGANPGAQAVGAVKRAA